MSQKKTPCLSTDTLGSTVAGKCHSTSGGKKAGANLVLIEAAAVKPPKPKDLAQLGKLDRAGFPDQPSSAGKTLPVTCENFEHLLKEYGITARFNVVKKRVDVEIPGHTPSMQNRDEVVLAHLESVAARNEMPASMIQRYLLSIADDNPFDPFAEWIDSKPWDGESRLPAIVATLTPTDDYPAAMAKVLIEKWLLSIVAATYQMKGFRARGVLTLQGGQGIGKTTWIGNLVTPQGLREDVVKLGFSWDAGRKDARLNALRHRIVELGELEGSFRREMSGLKAFITEAVDKIRPPYARVEAEYHRSTIFAASVNDPQFLIDGTGNSRFWTIPVKEIDYEHVIDMQQVFAELKVSLENGDQWWLTQSEEEKLAQINHEHRYLTAIEIKIGEALDLNRKGEFGLPRLSANEVLDKLGYPKPTNPQSKEANSALRQLLGDPKKVKGKYVWYVPWKKHDPNGTEYFDDPEAHRY